MLDIRCTVYDVRCAVLKYFILILLFISFSSVKSQNTSVDSTEIHNRMAFQDSIFKGLIKARPYVEPKKINTIPATTAIPANSSSTIDTQTVEQSRNTDTLINKSFLTENNSKGKNKKQHKPDTTHYSPKKAAVWGAAFPGLGQVYNKRYWKLPIVYGVLGTVMYFVASNGKKLKTFNGYIRNVYDSVPNPAPYDQLDLNEIETFRNTYRRNVQIASFGTLFAWGLSIVDAVVDAHLRSFDISDNLSLKVKPELNYSNFTYYAGIGVHLNLK